MQRAQLLSSYDFLPLSVHRNGGRFIEMTSLVRDQTSSNIKVSVGTICFIMYSAELEFFCTCNRIITLPESRHSALNISSVNKNYCTGVLLNIKMKTKITKLILNATSLLPGRMIILSSYMYH